jgi:hypothetical protein
LRTTATTATTATSTTITSGANAVVALLLIRPALDMEVVQEQPVIRRSENIQIRVGVGVGVVVVLAVCSQNRALMTSVRCQGGRFPMRI